MPAVLHTGPQLAKRSFFQYSDVRSVTIETGLASRVKAAAETYHEHYTNFGQMLKVTL